MHIPEALPDNIILPVKPVTEIEDHVSATAWPLLEVPEETTLLKSDDDHPSSAQEY